MEVKNFLWVQNLGTSDVSLSDLGVKVLAGKTINVYQANPYLTEERVEHSKKLGSLFKRLATKTLKIVVGPVSENVSQLKKLKASDKPIMAKKTKSSVVVEPDLLGEEAEKFDFADYGVSDLGITKDKNSIVMTAKQDEIIEKKKEVESKKLRDETAKNSINPIGPLVEMVNPEKSMAVVAKPEKKETKPAPTIKKNQSGSIVVGEETDKPRSLKAIKEGKQESGQVLEDDAAGADKIINFEQEEGMRVATKNEDGIVIIEKKKVKKTKSSK